MRARAVPPRPAPSVCARALSTCASSVDARPEGRPASTILPRARALNVGEDSDSGGGIDSEGYSAPSPDTAHFSELGPDDDSAEAADVRESSTSAPLFPPLGTAPPSPASSGSPSAGEDAALPRFSDPFVAPPPAFFAPMIGSILHFLSEAQQRPQPKQQPQSAAQPLVAVVSPAASPTPTPVATEAVAATALARPATAPTSALFVLNFSDPVIQLLFPRYPLPPRPPTLLCAPFPVAPRPFTRASYSAWLASLSPRLQLHRFALRCVTGDHSFHRWLVSAIGARYYAMDRPAFDAWMARVTASRVAALRRREREELRLALDTAHAESGSERTRVRLVRLREQAAATQRLHSLSLSIMHTNALRNAARQRGDREGERLRARSLATLRRDVLFFCCVWGPKRKKSAERTAARIVAGALRREPFTPGPRTGGPGAEARAIASVHARVMKEITAEQQRWMKRMSRARAQQQEKRRRQPMAAGAVWRCAWPIDHSNPPQSFPELLAYYALPGSPRHALELMRHRWWTREMERRREEETQLVGADGAGRDVDGWLTEQRLRWKRFLLKERRAIDAVIDDVRQQETRRRAQLATKTRAFIASLTRVTPADVVALCHHVAELLAPQLPLPTASHPDLLAAREPPAADVLSSIPVSPFSQPYRALYAARIPAVLPLTQRVYEDERSSVLIVALVGVRRDFMERVHAALVDAVRGRGSAVQTSDLVKVGEGAELEVSGESEPDAALKEAAYLDAAQRGWTMLDMGDVVLQTHSDDERSHDAAVHLDAAVREVDSDEAQRRMHEAVLSRLSMLSKPVPWRPNT